MSSSPTDIARLSESRFVLDASALLALILREPGQERVEQAILEGSVASTVNVAETVSRLVDLAYDEEHIRLTLDALRLQITSFDAAVAVRSGLLRSSTRHLGLSLGDRACLALAAALGLPAVTADRSWAQLDIGVQVDVIR